MSENGNDFFETIASKRKQWCFITLNTYIHDVGLPEQIKEKMQESDLHVDTAKEYSIQVTFDMKAYSDPEFYKFPVERRQWEIEKLKALDANEKMKTIIGDVLFQQLKNICKVLDCFHIPYRNAYIVGDNLENADRIEVEIVEITPDKTEEISVGKSKKSKPQSKARAVLSIIPDRSYIIKRAAKVFADMYLRKVREDAKKEFEMSKHTPNMIAAAEVFSALAKAIVDEFPEKYDSLEDLANKLLSQARLGSDWPLEIGYGGSVSESNSIIDADSKIDCPEYLIFIKKRHDWVLKKETDLDSAKHTVLFNGYNKKFVEQVIVLHNLENVRFDLFVVDNEEIKPVSKSEAHTAKKLYLRWRDNK